MDVIHHTNEDRSARPAPVAGSVALLVGALLSLALIGWDRYTSSAAPVAQADQRTASSEEPRVRAGGPARAMGHPQLR